MKTELEMLRESEWFEFKGLILRKKDIDYFDFNGIVEITCHYHLGLSYLLATEKMTQDAFFERARLIKAIFGLPE